MRTSRLAIVALVCAILLWPLGAILGIVAIIRILQRPDELRGMGLAIAAAVVGVVLSTLAVVTSTIMLPQFERFQCRSKQAEAKTVLNQFYTAELSYQAEHNRLGKLEDIDFQMDTATGRYEIRLLSVDNEAQPQAFLAQVKAIDEDLAGDTWTIDQDGTLTNVVNGCQ